MGAWEEGAWGQRELSLSFFWCFCDEDHLENLMGRGLGSIN
jgi:hypothetical protein